MKERENKAGTYKPINKTLIFVLFEAALVGREEQLIMETLHRNRHIFWNGKIHVLISPLLFVLISKINLCSKYNSEHLEYIKNTQ